MNSARHLKQVRKRVNRCIDFTQLRQSSRPKSFGNWLQEGVILVLGNALPRLLVRIRLVAERSICDGKIKSRSENRRRAENTPRRDFVDDTLECGACVLIMTGPELAIALKHESEDVLGIVRLSWTRSACCLFSPKDCFVEVTFQDRLIHAVYENRFVGRILRDTGKLFGGFIQPTFLLILLSLERDNELIVRRDFQSAIVSCVCLAARPNGQSMSYARLVQSRVLRGSSSIALAR